MIKYFFFIAISLFLSLGFFLDITSKPVKVDIIVCLGGNDKHRLPTSISLLKEGYSNYNQILYLGTESRLSSRKKDIKNFGSFIFSKSFKNTKEEVDYLESLLFKINYKSMLIVTEPMHSRRVDILIKSFTSKLKKDVKYTFISTKQDWWNKYLFFTDIKSIIHSVLEFTKIIHNYIKYEFIKDSNYIDNIDSLASEIKQYVSKTFKY